MRVVGIHRQKTANRAETVPRGAGLRLENVGDCVFDVVRFHRRTCSQFTHVSKRCMQIGKNQAYLPFEFGARAKYHRHRTCPICGDRLRMQPLCESHICSSLKS